MTRLQAVDFLLEKPEQFGRLIGFTKLGNLHRRWIQKIVQSKDNITIMASRGTFKTTCVAIAIAIILILMPNKRIMFMRKTDSDVKEVIKTVAKILQTPQVQYIVQTIYGVNLKLLSDTATEIRTNLTTDNRGTPQLLGIGTRASLTGKHFDYIFTDDIVNIEDRVSKTERERTKLVYQELQNIINRDGRIVNTGTPWHEEDAFSLMPKPEKYDCYNPDVSEIISEDELQKLKESMIPSLFAANYELRFIASENVIFTEPNTGADDSKCEQGVMQVDAAFYGEDYTAWSVMVRKDDKFYLYGQIRRQHIEDCYGEIMADYERFMCGKILMEDNADKGMVAKEMRKLGLKVITYHESMNKYIKIVTYLKAIWKNLYFVNSTGDDYIRQITDFYEDSAHDDAPDSAASLARVMNNKKAEYTPLYMMR